jgi:citrate lyase alpha subunit
LRCTTFASGSMSDSAVLGSPSPTYCNGEHNSHQAFKGRLMAAGLPVRDISGLRKAADKAAGTPRPAEVGEKIVAVVEYRDGTLIDVVRQVAI